MDSPRPATLTADRDCPGFDRLLSDWDGSRKRSNESEHSVQMNSKMTSSPRRSSAERRPFAAARPEPHDSQINLFLKPFVFKNSSRDLLECKLCDLMIGSGMVAGRNVDKDRAFRPWGLEAS